jgi:hypothetical protein
MAGKWQAQLQEPRFAEQRRHVVAARGLGLEVLRKYRGGFRRLRRKAQRDQEPGGSDGKAAADRIALTFPFFATPGDFDGRPPSSAHELELQRFKMRDVYDKAWQRLHPYGRRA